MTEITIEHTEAKFCEYMAINQLKDIQYNHPNLYKQYKRTIVNMSSQERTEFYDQIDNLIQRHLMNKLSS
jgi:hypothetical protein